MLQHLHLQGDIRNGYAEAIDLDLELSDGMYYGRLYINSLRILSYKHANHALSTTVNQSDTHIRVEP